MEAVNNLHVIRREKSDQGEMEVKNWRYCAMLQQGAVFVTCGAAEGGRKSHGPHCPLIDMGQIDKRGVPGCGPDSRFEAWLHCMPELS